MSTQTIQILITAVLALHGVAFARGAFTLFTQWLSRSNHGWLPLRFLLYPSLSAPATAAIAGIFWLLAAIGFLGSAMAFWGILVPGEIWRQLAIGGAIISTIGIILFSGIWPGAPTKRMSQLDTVIGMVVNVAILVCLLWLEWPPVSMFGK